MTTNNILIFNRRYVDSFMVGIFQPVMLKFSESVSFLENYRPFTLKNAGVSTRLALKNPGFQGIPRDSNQVATLVFQHGDLFVRRLR